MIDKVVILFEALRMGIPVTIDKRKYKLREDGQLLFECDHIKGDIRDTVWLGYPSEISSLIILSRDLTDAEAFLISANITLNNIKRTEAKKRRT